MNTIENNKLIAEFMGLKVGIYPSIDGKGYWETPIGDVSRAEADRLPCHQSWDWLMPVVEKIESLSIVSFEKNLQEDGDYQCLFTNGYEILICHYADTSIEATYKAVVEFVKWYKKSK